jgi:PAS domain S-box-containing protein
MVSLLRVLIIEPDPTDAEMLEMQLRKAKIACTTQRVATKEQYQKALQAAPPDLIIADTAVPRFDVLAAMRSARETLPGLPWIIISGVLGEEHAVAAMKAGAGDYLHKKHLNRLGQAVTDALRAQSTASARQTSASPQQEGAATDERLFRRIVTSTDDLIAVLDVNGRHVYDNPAHGTILDDPEALRGTMAFLDIHPEDREEVRRLYMEGVLSGQSRRLEFRIVDRQGNVRHMEAQANMMQGGSTGEKKVVLVSRDISERKRQEILLTRLLENTGPTWGEDFLHVLVKELGQALGVRYTLVSECLYQPCERVRVLAAWGNNTWVPSYEYDLAGTTCEQVFQTGQVVVYDQDVRELFPEQSALTRMGIVSYLGVPLLDAKSVVVGHIAVMHTRPIPDVPLARALIYLMSPRTAVELERFHMMSMLQAHDTRQRAILDALPEGLVVVDLNDVVTFVNNRLASMMEGTAVSMIGKPVQSVLPDEVLGLREDAVGGVSGVTGWLPAHILLDSGTELRVVSRAMALRDLEGNVLGTVYALSEVPV